MNKKKIINSVKMQEEEKVAISLKLPVSLKSGIQKLAESESISMNALIVATLQSMINDDCGKQLAQATPILLEYQSILSKGIEDFDINNVFDKEDYERFERSEATIKQIYEITS